MKGSQQDNKLIIQSTHNKKQFNAFIQTVKTKEFTALDSKESWLALLNYQHSERTDD